jgi:glycosyltransferase involved in cell wall biosynthesis
VYAECRDVRVLLTTHAFLPRSVAGVEVYTARLAHSLQDLGHDVAVLTAAHDLTARPYSVNRSTHAGLKVIEIANPQLGGTLDKTYQVPAIDRAVARVIEEFHPDCVHAQHLLNLSTGLFAAARARDARTAFTLHDYWLSCPRDGLRMQADGTLCASVDYPTCSRCLGDSPYLAPPLQRWTTRAAQGLGLGGALHVLHRSAPRATTALLRVMRRGPTVDLVGDLEARAAHLRDRVGALDVMLAPTGFARDRALEWGVPAHKLRVLPLGAVAGPTRPRLAGPRKRMGYVGTLAPHKGVHVLLEAFRALARPDCSLDVVGNPALDPAYSARLRTLAAGDRRVRFRGAIPPDEIGELWDELDLLVLPSLWWENSPLTVLEALAAGIPVVASRTGGVPEIVPDGAGAFVPPGDVAALRGTLEAVLEGRCLAGPLAPLPLKTTREGAEELVALYAALRGNDRPA